MKASILAVIVLVVVVTLWLRFRSATPDVPPLSVANDDPEMLAARVNARASVSEFLRLYEAHPKEAYVKWPFVTSSGQTEHLFAEVLGRTGELLQIRLVTPPVSHTGQLERLHSIPLKDISDWVVTLPNGKKKGGFTMRVMFKKAREQWGELPAKLHAEESTYE
jgi:uncharacterized protein YegJ (DUF2314 family)